MNSKTLKITIPTILQQFSAANTQKINDDEQKDEHDVVQLPLPDIDKYDKFVLQFDQAYFGEEPNYCTCVVVAWLPKLSRYIVLTRYTQYLDEYTSSFQYHLEEVSSQALFRTKLNKQLTTVPLPKPLINLSLFYEQKELYDAAKYLKLNEKYSSYQKYEPRHIETIESSYLQSVVRSRTQKRVSAEFDLFPTVSQDFKIQLLKEVEDLFLQSFSLAISRFQKPDLIVINKEIAKYFGICENINERRLIVNQYIPFCQFSEYQQQEGAAPLDKLKSLDLNLQNQMYEFLNNYQPELIPSLQLQQRNITSSNLLKNKLIFQSKYIKVQNQYFQILKQVILDLQISLLTGKFPSVLASFLDFILEQINSIKNFQLRSTALQVFNKIHENYFQNLQIQEELLTQLDIDKYVQQQINQQTYKQLPFVLVFDLFYDKLLQLSCLVFSTTLHEQFELPMICFYRIFRNIMEPFLKDTMWTSFEQFCDKFLILPKHNKDEEVVLQLREDDDLLQKMDECIDPNTMKQLKIKQRLTDLRKQHILLIENLYQVGFCFEDVYYQSFPFHIQINMVHDDNADGINILQQPPIKDCMKYYADYINTLLKRHYCLSVSDFLSFKIQIEQNTQSSVQQQLVEYLVTSKQYSNQFYAEQSLQFISLPMNMVLEEFSNLDQNLNEFESILQMTSDIIMENFNIDIEKQLVDQFFKSDSLQIITDSIQVFQKQNDDLFGNLINTDSYDSVNLLQIHLLTFMQDRQYQPNINFQLLNVILNFKIQNKKLLGHLLQSKLYYFLFKVDTSVINNFYVTYLDRYKLQLFNKAKLLLEKYNNELLKQMKLIFFTMKDNEANPSKLGNVIQLRRSVTNEIIIQYYNFLFKFNFDSSFQLLHIFGDVDSQQNELVNQLYIQVENLLQLERYIVIRTKSKVVEAQNFDADLQFYSLEQLHDLHKKKFTKFQNCIRQVNLNFLDSQQIVLSAFHKLVREIKMSAAIQKIRSKAYQQYIIVSKAWLVKHFATIIYFIQNSIFSNIHEIANMNDGSHQFQLSQQYMTNDLQLISLDQIGINQIKEKTIQFYDFPSFYLEFNLTNCSKVDLKFEYEFITQFSKFTNLPLISVNNDSLLPLGYKPSEFDYCQTPFLKKVLNDANKNSSYYKISDNFVKYAISLNKLMAVLEELIIVFKFLSKWSQWLQEAHSEIEKYDNIMENIKQMVIYIGPIYNIISNYFMIIFLFNNVKSVPLSAVPFEVIKLHFKSFINNILKFKQQYRQFHLYLMAESIHFDSRFLEILDYLVKQLFEIIKPYQILNVFLNPYILPVQLNETSKLFDFFVDSGLEQKTDQILNILDSNPQFYQYSMNLQNQIECNQTVYESLKQMYANLASFNIKLDSLPLIQYSSQEIFNFSIQPVNFLNLVNHYQLYLYILLNRKQKLIANQILIFARDIENIILNTKEFYHIMKRFPYLLFDLQLVKQFGNMIEVDFYQLEDVNIEQQVVGLKTGKLVQNKYSLLNLQLQQKQTPISLKPIQAAIKRLKNKILVDKQMRDKARIHKINLLSNHEINIISQAYNHTFSFAKAFKNHSIIDISIKYQEIHKFQKFSSDMLQITKRLMTETFGNIFKIFQNYQSNRLSNQTISETQTQYDIYELGEQKNIFMMNIEQINLEDEIQHKHDNKLSNYKDFKLIQNQLTVSQYPPTGIIIPQINGRFYFQFLVYDTTIFTKFADFQNWNILFQKDVQLNKLFFENVDNFVIENSPTRGKILTQLNSGSEKFVLSKPVQCPQVLYQLPDLLGEAVNLSFCLQISSVVTSLRLSKFSIFLVTVPYQLQYIALHMVEIDIIQQLKLFIIQMKNKPPSYIPIMNRMQEILDLDQSKAIKFYVKQDKLFIQQYDIAVYNIYLGQPQSSETHLLINHNFSVLHQMFSAIQQRQAIFICDTVNPTQQSQKQLDYTFMHLSRLLARKIFKIQFTEAAFYSQVRQFLKYICAGYIVLFYNSDVLSSNYIAILCDLCLCIQNQQGIINSMFMSDLNQHKINQIVNKKVKGLQLTTDDRLAEQDLILRNADMKDFGSNLGYFYFILNCIDDIPQEQFELLQQVKTPFLQLSDPEKYSMIFNQFSNYQLVNVMQTNELNENQILKDFIAVNPAHGQLYYQLSRILNQFDVKFCQLLPQDIAMLQDMCRNPTDSLSMGILLFDFIARQYFDFKVRQKGFNQKFILGFQDFSDFHIVQQMRLKRQIRSTEVEDQDTFQMNANFLMISNIIESVLGLRKSKDKKAVSLVEQAKIYSMMIVRISSSKSGKLHQQNFGKYFDKFLAPVMSQVIITQISQINQSNRVPLGMAYEILMLSHIFGRFKQQILLQCANQQYAKLVGIYLQNFAMQGKRQTHFATNNFDLMSYRRLITSNDILFCIPTTVSEFKKMALTLKQIELQQNACRIIALMPNMLEFKKSDFPFINTFNRRFLLIPDFFDQLGLSLFMLSNKIFNFSSVKRYIFEQSVLFDVSERYAFSTSSIQSNTLNIHAKFFRLKLLWQMYSGLFTGLFSEMIQINGVGGQIEEFMIIRSIFDFFMLKFKVFKIHQSSLNTDIQNDNLMPKQNGEVVMETIFNGISKSSEQTPLFYGMLQSMLRQFYIEHNVMCSPIAGFQQQDLIAMQEKITNIMRNNPDAITKNDQSLILEILLNNGCGYGVGNQGSLQFNFDDEFVIRYIFKPESTYQAMFNVFQPIAVSLFNAFYLYCQFSSALFIPVRRYDTFLEIFRKHDPDRYKRDVVANHQLLQPLQLIIYEHSSDFQPCDALNIKNKYTNSQNLIKSFYDLLGKKLADNFPDRQFTYLFFDNPNNPFTFQGYLCGKGILSNVELHKFIQIYSQKQQQKIKLDQRKDVQLFDQDADLDMMDMWQDEDEHDFNPNQKVDANIRLQELMKAQQESIKVQNQQEAQDLDQHQIDERDQEVEELDDAISEARSNKSFVTVQFQKVQPNIKMQELQQLFTDQFATLQSKSIDIQQIESQIPLYFDDERMALSVLIACSMLTPITFALSGSRFTGKTILINLAKLLIRDICMVHTSIFNELTSEASTACLQAGITKYYQQVQFPFCKNFKNEQVYISEIQLAQDTLPLVMVQYYIQSLNFYEQAVAKDVIDGQQSSQQFKQLLSMSNKMQKINQIVEEQEQIKKQIIPKYPDIIQNIPFNQQLMYYTETFAYPCFHLQCSCFNHEQQLSDNVISIIKDHSLQFNNIQSPTFMNAMPFDSFQNRQIGQMILSDTSFLLEISMETDDDILPMLSNINIVFKMPKINMSYLRKYFRCLLVNKRTTMPEEWVQSFLNGMNLIKGCLPINLFKNFQFFRILLKDELFHLPSFDKLVKESKRQARINQRISHQDQIRDMRPDLWLRLVSNYQNYNEKLEALLVKDPKKFKFDTFLAQLIEMISIEKQQQPTQMQTIMALNQDEIFKSLSIYSLVSNLKQEGCNNVRILNSLERFTSLYLLGYLNQEKLENQETDITKFQLIHPWQDTQHYKQLYPSFQSVLISTSLRSFASKSKQHQIAESNAIKASLTNKFAMKIFNISRPLLIDYEKLLKKLPLRKVFKGFLNPLPGTQEIVYLFEKFLIEHAYKNLYHCGLVASGLHQANSFFISHIIQLFTKCADQLDPMLLLSIFKLYLEIIIMKQSNASIIQTSIQTYTAFEIDASALTGHHACDYLRNFKLFMIGILQQFAIDKIVVKDENKKKKAIMMTSRRGQEDQHTQEQQVQVIHDQSMEETDADSTQNQEEDEVIDQQFNGFQETMLMSLRIPRFLLRLNTNSNINQYNCFIQYLEYISQYKILSNDTFQKTISNMANDEGDDINDNQSVLSKGSKFSAQSASSRLSGTSSIINQAYATEMKETQKVNDEENADVTFLSFKQFQFLNSSKQEGKFIIDISIIIQTLNNSSQEKKKQKKNREDVQTTGDLLSGLTQFLFDIQQNTALSVDGQEYVIILQIIRYAILLALGVKPNLVFNMQGFNQNKLLTQYNQHSQIIGLSLNSGLQNIIPQSQNQTGILYGEVGQLAHQLSSNLSSRIDYYNERIINSKEENHKMYNVISGISYPDLSEQASKHLNADPFDIIIITPRSLLQRRSHHGVTLENTINQALQSNTFVQSLFDYEELQYLMKLVSINLDFNHTFDLKALNALLSVCLSIIIIDDAPKIYNEENEYGNVSLNKDNLENLGQVGNIIETAVNSLSINNLTKTQIGEDNDDVLTLLKFNSINFRYNDLINLYKISGCQLPIEIDEINDYNIDSKKTRLEYAHCAVAVYKQIMELTNCWSISFYEFTNVASTIVNHIYTQIDNFNNNVKYIQILFKYFSGLSAPTQTEAKMVDMFAYNKNTITNNIYSALKEVEQGKSIKQQFGFESSFVSIVRHLLQLRDGSELIDKLINKKYKSNSINEQLFLSIGEAYYQRDYLFTVIEMLRSNIKIYFEAMKSAHFDGIIIACYLYFYQTGQLSDQKIYQTLQTGKFPKTFGKCEELVQLMNDQSLQEIQSHYDIFQIFVCAIVQDSGFFTDIKLSGIPLVSWNVQGQVKEAEIVITENSSQTNPVYILGHLCIPNQIQNYYIHISSFDYPILMILKQLNIKFKNDDPDLVNLYNVGIFSRVLNKNTFLVEQQMLQPTICLLEAFRRQNQSNESYQKVNEDVLNGVKNDIQRQLTTEFIKKAIVIDMLLPPTQFNSQLARVIQMSDSQIIFANFGPQANANNCSQMRKFMQLRARRLIQKRQTINIGNASAFTGQALHRFSVIISFQYDKCDIIKQIEYLGLLSQEFVDNLVIVGKLLSQNKQSVDISNENIIAQNLMEAVFDEHSTKRNYLEGYRNLLCKYKNDLNRLQLVVQQYCQNHYFDSMIENWQSRVQRSNIKTSSVKYQQVDKDDDDNKEKVETNFITIPDEDFQTFINQLIPNDNPLVIVQTALCSSYTLNSSPIQHEDFWQLCLVFLSIVTCEFQRQQYSFVPKDDVVSRQDIQQLPYRSSKSVKVFLDYQNKPSVAKTSTQKLVQSIGNDYCYQIALCLSYSIEFIQQLSQKYISLQYLLSSNFVQNICAEIRKNLPQLNQKAQDVNMQHTKQLSEKIKQGFEVIPDKYPLAFALGHEKQIVNEFLVSVILPVLQKLICPCLSLSYATSLYFFINIIFFTVFQQDECFKTKRQISQFIQLILHTMHSTDIDDFRMFTAHQLISIFSQKSRFKANEALFVNQSQIVDIKHLLPEITGMSEILQESWIKLISLQKNYIINDSLPWLLKHHSSFVVMNQCKHLFASFIVFYLRNTPNQIALFTGILETLGNFAQQIQEENNDQQEESDEEKKEQSQEEQNEDKEEKEVQKVDKEIPLSTKFSGIINSQKLEQKQLTQLPPLLQSPSPQGFYAILLICNMLQPHNLNDNILMYQYLMAGFLNIQSSLNIIQILKDYYPSVINQNTGVIKDGQFTIQYERSRNLNKLVTDFSPIFTSFIKYISPEIKLQEFIKYQQNFVSENLFILSECLYISASELQKYVAKVKDAMTKSEYDPLKHYQYISKCGNTPDNIFVIFYDEKIDVKQLFQFIYCNIDIKIMRNIPLMFASIFDIQKMRDMIFISIINPENGGIDILKSAIDVFNQKKTVYPHILILPVFIFIPIQSRQLDDHTHHQFMQQFVKFINITSPTFAFLHQYKSLNQAFSHNLVTILGTYYNYLVHTTTYQNESKQTNIQIPIIKSLFRAVFLQIQQNVDAYDSELINQINNILFQQTQAIPVDLKRDVSDVVFIQLLEAQTSASDNIYQIVQGFLKSILTKRYYVQNMSSRSIKMDDLNEMDQNILEEMMQQFDQQNNSIKLDDLYEDDKEHSDQNFDNDQIDLDDLDAAFNRDDEDEYENSDENNQVDNFGDNLNTTGSISGVSFNLNKIGQEHDDEIEDSIYLNILDQLSLYETHLEIEDQLDLPRIENSIIKLIKCQKRSLKVKTLEIYFIQIGKIITKMIDEFFNYQQRNVSDTMFNLLSRVITFLQQHIKLIRNDSQQQAYAYRSFMSSQIVQTMVFEMQFQYEPHDSLPPLLQYFIQNVPNYDYYKQMSKQYSAKVLFSSIVNQALNTDNNAVVGLRQFGGYQNEWVFNVSQYVNAMKSIFTFVRFRTSIITNTKLNQQHILLILEKQLKMPQLDQDGNITFISAQNHEAADAFTYILRELELVGASYDANLSTFCDENFEHLIGYRQIFDVYLYCLASDCKHIQIPSGYIALPMIINQMAVGTVFVKNLCQYDDFELAVKRAHFTVTKI